MRQAKGEGNGDPGAGASGPFLEPGAAGGGEVPVGRPVPEAADLDPGARYAADTPPGTWMPDVLGPGFEYLSLPAGRDGEGPVGATLVRHRPGGPDGRPGAALRGALGRALARARGEAAVPPPAVLAVHGWSDYFYNAGLARHWTGRGFRFHALDLRRYGRSLRPWQTPGYVTDLAEYDADLRAALAAIERDLGGRPRPLVLQGHSTGGLVAALWAARNPGAVDALVLNAPWLEMQGSALVRHAASGILDPVARLRPRTRVRLPETDHYWQSLSRQARGEWDLHPVWRPRHAFQVTAGWITAVMTGHAAVARGLDLDIPVLVLTSDRTVYGTQFTEAMLSADAVIDVARVRQRALGLGRDVTLATVPGAMHDVFTSSARARADAYRALDGWAFGHLRAGRERDPRPGRV